MTDADLKHILEIRRIGQFAAVILLALCILTIDRSTLIYAASIETKSLEMQPGLPGVTQTERSNQEGEAVPFTRLGYEERTLHGPSSSFAIFFSMPADWQLLDGASLQLNFTVLGLSEGGIDDRRGPTREQTRTSYEVLEVKFNNISLGIIDLIDNGPQTITYPIPSEALVSPRLDERHQLWLQVRSDRLCDAEQHVGVVIHPTSQLLLPHAQGSPTIELARLPQPIFQRSFVPDSALIVVPDAADTADLQTALNVAAGFGSMTDSSLAMTLTTESLLTEQLRAGHHMILINQSDKLRLADDFILPLNTNMERTTTGVQRDDGLIQMAISPWNPSKIVLTVGGDTAAGLIKAGQAVSTGSIQPGPAPNVVIVAAVQPSVVAVPSVSTSQTFSGLGYDLETIEGTGRRTLQFKFTVSPDQILHDDGVVDFKFAHSNLVDYARSGVVVLLNDKPVGSIRLGETTADLTSSVIRLPKNLVKSGLNRLTVQADLRSALTCSGLDGSGAWLTVYPSSALNLPLSPSTEASPHVQNLSDYPNLITLGNTLNNLAFVLPKSAPMAWNLASRFAFDLGRRADIDLADLAVVFDSALDESVKRERDLIVIGTPTRLPLLAEFNASLPVPFEAGSNRLVAVELSAAYRLPLETKMGYLQLLRAPWNQARTIVNVLGSSPEGMALAAVALLDGQRRSMLAGNFALVDEMQVSVRQLMPASAGLNISDIPLNESGESLLASQPGLNDLELAFQANPIVYEQPAWILPTLLASLIIAFAIGLWVTLSSIWARRPKSA